MRDRTTVLVWCIVLGLAVICAIPAQANPNYVLPSQPGTVHFNSNPIDLPPWHRFYHAFSDFLSGYKWMWETELSNPNPYPINSTWGWYYKGTLLGAYSVSLQPGSSFYAGWAINEQPETGWWSFGAYNGTPVTWRLHSTIVEDVPNPIGPGGITQATTGVQWYALGYNAVPDNRLDMVPEPGSLLALGCGLIGVAGAIIRRRR